MKLFLHKRIALLVLVALGTTSSFAQTIYSQDFESVDTLPAGWSQTSVATDGGWKVGTSKTLSSHYFTFAPSSKFIATNDDTCTCDKSNDFLKTGPIDLRNHSYVYLSFDSYYYGGSDNLKPPHSESALVKVSTDSGATWTTVATIPGNKYTEWVTRYVNLSGFAGDSSVMLAFVYSDGGGQMYGWGVDNVNVFVPADADLSVVNVSPATGSFASYGMPGAQMNISFVVFNNSRSTISSFNASYTIDGITKTQKIYADVNPFSYDTSGFSTIYTIPSAGDHIVRVVTNIAGDANPVDDTAYTTIGGGAFSPTHTLVLEEATGCWCGYCPAGTIAMDSMANLYPVNTALIAVHDALSGPDAMAFVNYDYPMAYLLNFSGAAGYPTVFADRKSHYDPAPQVFPAFAAYTDHINDFGIADITSVITYTPSIRRVNVQATVNFAVNTTNANARLACVFTEDGVHGTSSDYNQNNYYSSSVLNEPLVGAGHNWQKEVQWVPAAKMYYNHVARAIVGTFTGTVSTLPANIMASTPYVCTFSYIVPAGYNVNNMKAIVMLINPNTDEVFNASSPQTVTGINDLKSDIDQLSLYPNPATNQLNILFNLAKPQSVIFQVTDITGRLVSSMPYNNLEAANHTIHLPIDNLASGIYILNIRTDSGLVSTKFVKE